MAFAACDKADNADHSDSAPADDDDDAVDDDAADDDATDDDTTDDDDDSTPPEFQKYLFDLDFELRGKAQMNLTQQGYDLTAEFIAETGNDVIQAGTRHSATGKYRLFDGQMRLYGVKFVGSPVTDGPCGSNRISYSVTLMAKQDNDYVGGGFVAYCGEDVFDGRPAQVYRLSGLQTKVEE
jgi:hypothetical protein